MHTPAVVAESELAAETAADMLARGNSPRGNSARSDSARANTAQGGVLRGALLAALWVTLALLPTLLTKLGANLNPDEHQFIVAGVLLAREGMLPYRDYAYFHVPNLALVYAALFSAVHSLLLSARLLSLAFGALLLLTLLLFTRRRWRAEGAPAPRWSEAAAALIFGLTPLFIYTSGRAWNHDLPILLTVWATLLLVYSLRAQAPWGWAPWVGLIVTGFLVGFAAGTRSSFAFLLLPLAVAAAVGAPTSARSVGPVLVRLVAFGAGATLGLLPVAYMAAQAPAAFIFGNLEYARLNTIYRIAEGFTTAMSLPGKLALLGGELLRPGNLVVLVAYLAFGLPQRRQWRNWPVQLRTLILVMLPFLLAGAFAPTPAWRQYFYVLMPFLWIAALDGLAARPPQWWGGQRAQRGLLLLLLLLASLYAFDNRRDLHATFTGRWYPVLYHNAGVEIAGLLGPQSHVLTLAPTLPLEGGLQIYPELATGPFALRAATMTTLEQQVANHLPPVGKLDGWLVGRPPRASLLRADRNDYADEKALADYVTATGFVPLPLRDKSTLYVNPLALWDENIRLAAMTRTPAAPVPGDTLAFLNYMQAQQPTAANLSRLLRLRHADGTSAGAVVAQAGGWPWGRPTTAWQPDELWFDGVEIALPADAPPGLYRAELALYDAETDALLPLALRMGNFTDGASYGEFFATGNWPGAPTTPLRPDTRIGDFAHLQGYTLAADAPDTLNLRLFWQGARPATADYTVFTQLLDGTGTPIAQHDKPPLGGFYPTSAWAPDLAFADDFVLPLPNPLPPGPYTLLVGMYDPATGARQPVAKQGQPAGDAVTMPVTLP
jgi:4-amino-4-deoxy-L-arabinose transferase-like glycosyltransferase